MKSSIIQKKKKIARNSLWAAYVDFFVLEIARRDRIELCQTCTTLKVICIKSKNKTIKNIKLGEIGF
jgi:hypothetical protein